MFLLRFENKNAVQHAKLMRGWIDQSCNDAAEITRKIMPNKEEATGLQRMVDITFPGAILAIGSAIAGLIFGLYTQQTKLTTQSEYQTRLLEQSIEGMRQELRETKTRVQAQESFIQDINNRVIRLEAR